VLFQNTCSNGAQKKIKGMKQKGFTLGGNWDITGEERGSPLRKVRRSG